MKFTFFTDADLIIIFISDTSAIVHTLDAANFQDILTVLSTKTFFALTAVAFILIVVGWPADSTIEARVG